MEEPFDEIRKSSALFGYIAIKKGYSTDQQIKYALAKQQRLFREKNIKQMVGDMLVESGVLTKEQQQIILKYQRAAKIDKDSKDKEGREKDSKEKEFIDKNSREQDRDKETQNSKKEKIEQYDIENENIKITVSANSMEAWVQVIPYSNESENEVTLSSIKSELKKKRVINGLLGDAILLCHIDRKDDFFPVAVGNYIFTHLPEYQFDFNSRSSHLINRINNAGSGNIPTDRPLIIAAPVISDTPIKRNKSLAFMKSDQVAIKTQDVFGNTSVVRDCDLSVLLRCGSWCSMSEDGANILSDQSGYPALSIEGKLYIFPVVNVLEDADLRFGPINQYASLNVAGVLTGAYPVNAGQIRAREIRGANVSSIGDISVEIGITGCRIKTQGNVRAKYIHKSRIEAFGDVVVEHEIIDSTIIISGSCSASSGRIIASKISAKMGVTAAGVGSNITEPCYINAGCEEHIVLKSLDISRQIGNVRKELDSIMEEKALLEQQIKEIFKKMVELKIIHDRAKAKSIELNEEVPKDIDPASDKASVNKLDDKIDIISENRAGEDKIFLILDDLQKKMEGTVDELKKYNQQKKNLAITLETTKNRISRVKPRVEQEIMQLEIDRNCFFKWAESKTSLPEINVLGKLSEGTILKGVYSSMTVNEDIRNIKLVEKFQGDVDKAYFVVVTE
ncbi:MAG: DUF342 domain-containing protein [Desulfamplus sp.]|nr:DUF342 domain-containing protein [Desulfamplus sp.]